jgi:ubiquinone/menaquinone biosynthesis C-methylase UbiE
MSKRNKNKITIEAYNKNALFYAEKFNSYGVLTEDIDRALRLNQSDSKKVLELGCGNGRDAEYIVSEVGKAGSYFGVDPSKELIRLAKKKHPKIEFQVKQMQDLEFESETFGIIFAFYSMLHVERSELLKILEKCGKWLKIGGILYITSKYGPYKELEIENLGDKKYYYAYEPEDVEGFMGNNFQTVFRVIKDSDYGPSFALALKKIRV